MLFTAAWVFAHSDVRGQTNEGSSSASNVRYPTMLDMTYKTARIGQAILQVLRAK
jgi:hypothetical protein